MAQVLPEVYDFRQHDRLWRRVQPGLEPYPEADTSGGNQAQTSDAGMTLAQESRLPGAEPNPCCMGTEAAELLTVLEGYIADELRSGGCIWHWPSERRSGRGRLCGSWRRMRAIIPGSL